MHEFDFLRYDADGMKMSTGTLDLLVGDSAVLDHLRANDPGCTLATHGDDLVSDTFSIAMGKGFPLRVKINTILARYLASGHIDHLKHKWYGELPCFRLSADIYKPQALEISTVAGVFLMLTLGIGLGFFLLILEHVVYRYVLPSLRTKPKESLWRNRNLMFFSQKLYKFTNCVELVSPHHSAKELVNNLRTGQIMGLFQKSVKRKENEQRRRRKSKAQFFEMIQEIRRVQKAEKEEAVPVSTTTTVTAGSKKGGSTPFHAPPETTPVPPSPFTTTNTQGPITIDYIRDLTLLKTPKASSWSTAPSLWGARNPSSPRDASKKARPKKTTQAQGLSFFESATPKKHLRPTT
ncbi:glutamate receptor ionotropic, NMDA 3A-like [Panulirus ornatus]|uniref:glutamate receptor ionotropic, NMDA 3A-like n=1 Tax=Panulirus ornatus TaxID=150431 RepID=UPI003A875F21